MESHVLISEFPEYAEEIVRLKVDDPQFQKLYVNYEEINAIIQHYEEDGVNHTTDQHLTELRRKRLYLKDNIYHLLHQ